MKKLSRISHLAIILSFISVPSFAQAYDPLIEFGFEVKLFDAVFPLNDGGDLRIKRVPVDLRQVPSHPNDRYIYGPVQVIRTIPYDSMDINMRPGLNISFSPELKIWRFRMRSGLNFYRSWYEDATPSNEKNTREINQYGQPVRGIGTSLVYYSIYGKNTWKPGFVYEADFDIGNNLVVIAGRSLNPYKLMVETGYDRWNSLEVYEIRHLADNTVERKYFGLGIQPPYHTGSEIFRPVLISFLVGKSRTEIQPKLPITSMDIGTSDFWNVQVNVSFHAPLFRKY